MTVMMFIIHGSCLLNPQLAMLVPISIATFVPDVIVDVPLVTLITAFLTFVVTMTMLVVSASSEEDFSGRSFREVLMSSWQALCFTAAFTGLLVGVFSHDLRADVRAVALITGVLALVFVILFFMIGNTNEKTARRH
jgi:hypothetical protein